MVVKLKELVKEFKTVLPTYEYVNGVAYEVFLENDFIEISLDRDGVISLACKLKIDITTDFIDDMYKVLEDLLDNEIESNKTSYYKYKYYYNGEV